MKSDDTSLLPFWLIISSPGIVVALGALLIWLDTFRSF